MSVVGGVHDRGFADRIQDVGENLFFRLAGEGDLIAADDL